jgi:hypothetical protein
VQVVSLFEAYSRKGGYTTGAGPKEAVRGDGDQPVGGGNWGNEGKWV